MVGHLKRISLPFHAIRTGFKKNIKIVKRKEETGSLKFPDVSSHPSCNLCLVKFLSRPNNT